MSYMYLILAKDGDPNLGLRLMDVPVEWRDGAFAVTGEPQDRQASADDICQMLPDDTADDHPMGPVNMPDGWQMIARFWQPARYVPESDEVRRHSRAEAVRHMLELGITTPEQAKRLLEDKDA